MILSDKCWMKAWCSKYNNSSVECKCRNSTEYCSKLFKLNKLYDESLMTDNQRARKILCVDADGSDRDVFLRLKEIEKSIETWVQNGNNLYMFSSICGNGKTSWAERFIQDYFEAIWYKSDLTCRALFINVPRFLISLKDNLSEKSTYIQHIKANVFDVDLVVFDDVAIKNATTYEMENLLNIIDYRSNAKKSNIYTSNICGQDLLDRVGERLYSRIINLSEIVEFKGQDKRGLVIKS